MKYSCYYIFLFTTLTFIMGIDFWIFDHFKTHECMFVKEEAAHPEASKAAEPSARVLEASNADAGGASPENPGETIDPKTDSKQAQDSPSSTEQPGDPAPPQETAETEPGDSTSSEPPASTPSLTEALETLKQATKNILIICPLLMGLTYLLSFVSSLIYCSAFCYFKSLYNKNPHNLSSPGFFAKARGFFLKSVPPLNRLLHFLVLVLIFAQTFIFYFHEGCQHVRTKDVFGQWTSSRLNGLRLHLLVIFVGFWVILEFFFAAWRVSINKVHFQYRPFAKDNGKFKRFICNLGYY